MWGKHSKEAQEMKFLGNKLKQKEEELRNFKMHVVKILEEIDRLNVSRDNATRRRISEIALDEKYKIMSEIALKNNELSTTAKSIDNSKNNHLC